MARKGSILLYFDLLREKVLLTMPNQEIKEAKQRNERVLVLTHHAPSMKKTSHPRFEKNEGGGNHAFSTPLESLMGKPIAVRIRDPRHLS